MKLGKLLLVLGLMVGNGPASAALVTIFGTDFDVTYDDTALGLFGAPTLSGDGKTILFSPLNFKVQSVDGAGTVLATSDVQLDITIHDPTKFVISQIDLKESGDYTVFDEDTTQPPRPSVKAFGELRVTNLQTGSDFVANNFDTGFITLPNNGAVTPWNAQTTVVTPNSWIYVDSNTNLKTAPDVRVRIQDDLIARSFFLGDVAFIQKKAASETIGLTVVVQAVPVPAAIWLFGSALGAAGVIGRRRKV